jgi:site-specific DNA-methyltransferase (adenine-specific)
MSDVECRLIHDHFENARSYNIPRAQLIIADIPYNLGGNFYASRPDWYVDGDNRNGESKKAHKAAFLTDYSFNIADFFFFASRLLKKEPKTGERGAPCMIVFCAFEQIPRVLEEAEKYGFKHYIPLVFCKNYGPQVLKANMRIVGATEYALVLYRENCPSSATRTRTAKST